MKLKVSAMAVAGGVVLGGVIFLLTLSARIGGHGQHLALLQSLFWHYTISFRGTLIGGAYGFVCGFVGGGVFAWIYNLIAGEAKAS